VSATFREVDETMERGLFDRRARAMGAQGGVPSLEAVLRATNDEASVAVPVRAPREESRERSGARARAWSGVALAAACVIAVMKTVPHAGAPATIAADVAGDAGVSIASGATSDTCEGTEENACGIDPTCASGAVVAPVAPVAPIAAAAPEGRTCDAPIATFESSSTLSCDRDEANRSQMP